MYLCCGCICILFDILYLYFLYFYLCSYQGSVDSEEEEKEETGGGVQEVGGEGGEDFITICDTRVMMIMLSKDDDSDGDEYDF